MLYLTIIFFQKINIFLTNLESSCKRNSRTLLFRGFNIPCWLISFIEFTTFVTEGFEPRLKQTFIIGTNYIRIWSNA
jgi:hypothetical protein